MPSKDIDIGGSIVQPSAMLSIHMKHHRYSLDFDPLYVPYFATICQKASQTSFGGDTGPAVQALRNLLLGSCWAAPAWELAFGLQESAWRR